MSRKNHTLGKRALMYLGQEQCIACLCRACPVSASTRRRSALVAAERHARQAHIDHVFVPPSLKHHVL